MSDGPLFFSGGRQYPHPYWLASCDQEDGGRFFLGLRNGNTGDVDVIPTTNYGMPRKGIGTVEVQPRPQPHWKIIGDPLRVSDEEDEEEEDEVADHLVSGGTLRSVYRGRTYELRAQRPKCLSPGRPRTGRTP